MIKRQELLKYLPAYQDEWVMVHPNQEVKDIIAEILDAHKEFAGYYDLICPFFDAPTTGEVCKKLYRFCKENIRYQEESEARQTTALPAGLLTRGYGDCKHYASFCGGILDALNRNYGKNIDWHYCFASYDFFRTIPYHVFTVVNDKGGEIWIDPTPGAEDKNPVWVTNKKVKGMPLYRNIAGIADMDEGYVPDTSVEVPEILRGPIALLQSYGIISPLGEFNKNRLDFVTAILPDPEANAIRDAVAVIVARQATVGNWFDDAFKGIQHFAAGMGMQVPRASFLGLVRINAFGYANKLNRALQYQDSKDKLADLWERVGGTFSVLENTIKQGATQPVASRVTSTTDPAGTYRGADGKLYFTANNQLVGRAVGASIGIVPAVAAAAISSAAIIVAAIMPVISKLIDKHGTVANEIPLDPTTGLPVGYQAQNSLMSFVQNNPVIVVGLAALLGFVWYKYS